MATNSPFNMDLRRLAVGVLFVNLGRAAPEFPQTSRAHPSYRVQVALTSSGSSDAYGYLFPFFVTWHVWQNVIVPLFKNSDVLVKVIGEKHRSLRYPNNQIRLSQDLEGLLDSIELVLLTGLEEQGYLPSSATTVLYQAEIDPPLVYKTDTEMKTEVDEAAVRAVELAAWEAGDSVVPPTPPSTVPTLIPIVPAPAGPGEPVVQLGTVQLEYTQFDV